MAEVETSFEEISASNPYTFYVDEYRQKNHLADERPQIFVEPWAQSISEAW